MAVSPPLVALQGATLGFGGLPLFDGIDLGLGSGERACLVGRNGSGKSTLLKVLAGEQDLDTGNRFLQPGIRVAYLPQDPSLDSAMSVADYVAAGLAADESTVEGTGRHRLEAILKRLDLDGQRTLGTLSGGEGRRAALARTLVAAPDVLLLDEPTNHLDLPTIEWLEAEMARFRGALLVVSHDRTFLSAVTRATLWLDRGRLLRLDKSFAHFEDWADELAEREARDRHRLERQIVREQRWLARGITARRRRNQGRLARLKELRRQRAEWLRAPAGVTMAAAEAERAGQRVIEAEHLRKIFKTGDAKETVIVDDFSTRIRRGDRIGIIGPNGVGKTTLVRLLTKDLAPDAGRVVLGANVKPQYFDQRRESLDPEATLWQSLVPGGGDSLMVGHRQRHVVSYLRDFLFEESQARQPVKSLSGGERNRLLLARLFARPNNLLILDEPTNDLDMETLDLLVEVLDGYEGTLLLVSHDRDFLDRLVTGLFVVQGNGPVEQHVGGYSDYLAQRRIDAPEPEAAAKARPAPARATPARRPSPAKLSYKDARELAALPAEIDRLTSQIVRLEAVLGDPELYSKDPDRFARSTAELATTRAGLAAAEERWLELEERREQLAAPKDTEDDGKTADPRP